MTEPQIIYTDGSCSPNPGKGGWSFITFEDGQEWHVRGGDKNTTNNIMEITAVIESIDFAQKNDMVIYTDSKYVINCATNKWKRKVNVDLWRKYDEVSFGKNIEFMWVKSHTGDKYNEMVDELAKKESK